jgi:hypothetical protein
MKTNIIRVSGLLALALLTEVASAQLGPAVEWKPSDGGNGHWYSLYLVPGDSQSPEVHFGVAVAAGGHTATIQSAGENAFVFNLSAGTGALIGVRKNQGSNQGAWITGETWGYTNWNSGEGLNSWERYALMPAALAGKWIDTDLSPRLASVVEWDADCNGDGLVDYGQIVRGEVIDLNQNHVPDSCETSFNAVVPVSVSSLGGETITLRGNFPQSPVVVVGGVPATNVVRQSKTQIAFVCPALEPGFATVAVDGFVLPGALYIRSGCPSDLDQSGSVDAGDISILLVNFGPCEDIPLAAPGAPELPLLLEAEPEAPRKR